MKAGAPVPADVDAYLAGFAPPVAGLLAGLRAAIRKAAPQAEETISYRIPTYRLHGNLVHFAGYRSHIGFYPGASAIEAFRDQLAAYRTARGTVQLPLDRPLPLGLIGRMVRFRVRENRARAAARGR